MKKEIISILLLALVTFSSADLTIPCIPPTIISQTDRNDLQYYLYLQPGTPNYTELHYGQLANVTHNVGCPVVFITHGFTANAFAPWILDAKNKIFEAYSCANIVLVDWSNISSTFNYTDVLAVINMVYPYTAYRTCFSGKWVATILIEMNLVWGVNFCDVLLMGHSLGAHLMGCAGDYVKEGTGLMVDEIIGMDPAGPYFHGVNDSCRLSIDDAIFVQTVRTSVGTFGIVGRVGKVDYYVNGGQNQPGCLNEEWPVSQVCDHSYAYYVTFATFTTNRSGFDSRECTDYLTYELAMCNNNSLSQMGCYSRRDIAGSYFLDTSATYPYAKNGTLNSQTILEKLRSFISFLHLVV